MDRPKKQVYPSHIHHTSITHIYHTHPSLPLEIFISTFWNLRPRRSELCLRVKQTVSTMETKCFRTRNKMFHALEQMKQTL